ncbi:MAG: hypothetical protein AAGF11_22675 [Myxococcota bacterium]
MMRNELTMGTIVGTVLGGLVIFGLARSPTAEPAPVPQLVPLGSSDLVDVEDGPRVSTDGGHRPVRPGSQRLHGARS